MCALLLTLCGSYNILLANAVINFDEDKLSHTCSTDSFRFALLNVRKLKLYIIIKGPFIMGWGMDENWGS